MSALSGSEGSDWEPTTHYSLAKRYHFIRLYSSHNIQHEINGFDWEADTRRQGWDANAIRNCVFIIESTLSKTIRALEMLSDRGLAVHPSPAQALVSHQINFSLHWSLSHWSPAPLIIRLVCHSMAFIFKLKSVDIFDAKRQRNTICLHIDRIWDDNCRLLNDRRLINDVWL